MLVLMPMLPDTVKCWADNDHREPPARHRVMIDWSDGADGERLMVEMSDEWRERGAVFVMIELPMRGYAADELDKWHAELTRRANAAVQAVKRAGPLQFVP